MKARAAALALLVVLAACGSSAASPSTSTSGTTPAPAAGHCGPAAAATLASSNRARVYLWHGFVYGCSFSGTRSFRLGSATRGVRESQANPVAVAGDVVAYGLSSFGVDTVRTAVDVRRLTDGKSLGSFPVTHAGVVEGIESVGSLVVKAGGAVAWIGVARSVIGGRHAIEVHAAGASAATDKVLDSGPQIVPNSLRLRGSTLTWRDGTATRHASFG
jgi:hypothetical protein